MLACLIVGCGDAQQRNEQKKELPGHTGTIDSSAPANSSATGSAAPTYTINGKRAQPGEPGADGKVSLLASVSGDLNKDGHDDRAVILIMNSVGSGVFYHLNVFLDDRMVEWRFVGEVYTPEIITYK